MENLLSAIQTGAEAQVSAALAHIRSERDANVSIGRDKA